MNYMNSKFAKNYPKIVFLLYYLVFALFVLTSAFSMPPPITTNPEPTGLSSISPFFYIIFYFYPFVCGLVGVVLNLEKKYDNFARIISGIMNFPLYFSLTCIFYFLSILIFPSLISSIFQGVHDQFGFLIGFNLVNILQFYLFEFLRNGKLENLENL